MPLLRQLPRLRSLISGSRTSACTAGILALAVCAVLYVAGQRTKRIAPAFSDSSAVAATATGSFILGAGWYPGEPFAHAAPNLRAWGSWSGDDANTGTLALGPFPAPRVLRFGLGGYPANPGNTLHVELVDTAKKILIDHAPVGERWSIADIQLPPEWEGRAIRLLAVDQSTALGGWLALTEPIRGGRSDGNHALLQTYAAWAINGLLLGLLYLAAAHWLAAGDSVGGAGSPSRPEFQPPSRLNPLKHPLPLAGHWIPLAAGALVALCGYLVYWAYFIHPWLGWIATAAAFALGVSILLRRPEKNLSPTSAPAPLGKHVSVTPDASFPPLAPVPSVQSPRFAAIRTELRTVVALMLAVGAFHLAVLHLFPTAHDFYTLSANRFRDAMPGDNMLSHLFAERLFAGQPPKDSADAWQSSDRPPLQIGWQLLTWPASKLLQLDRRTASGTSAVWFQLLWIAGAYGLLRTFRLPPRRAAAWVALLGLTGFFIQNTTFTWPKLSAGAFACGAFALLLLGRGRERERVGENAMTSAAGGASCPDGIVARAESGHQAPPTASVFSWRRVSPQPRERVDEHPLTPAVARVPPANPTPDLRARGIWSALFAALAWLSHGGVAFSFLPLVPIVLWLAFRGAWRPWLPAALVFAAVALPWVAYQKFYDPPGNLLLKLHFAGQQSQDNRGVWETIRESYARIGWREAWAHKVTNFHSQVFGDWRHLGDVSTATKVERRNHEFFHTGRALTWWPVLAVFAVALARRRVLTDPRELGLLAAWLIATLGVTCLLIFGRYNASIHHGSYAVMLGLFALFSVLLERSGRGWLAVIAVLQTITFATTWAVSNPAIYGPTTGLPIVILTGAILAWFVLRSFSWDRGRPRPQSDLEPASTPTATPPLTAWDRIAAALRAWWANPRVNVWVLVAFTALCFLRKPHTFHTPQLWAEDGAIFLMQNDLHGLGAFVTPYAGYLHTIPRLIAWIASLLLDPAWWPAFYNGVAVTLWVAVMARFFSPRLALPGKPLIALALVLVPHPGEVFFNVTNLQWLTAFVLIQQVLVASPRNALERTTDLTIVALITLTGPFGIALLPLFAWRWWLKRDRDNTVLLAVLLACALLQAWFVVRTGQRFDYQSEPFRLWPNVVVIARRLLAWPILGYDIAQALSPLWLGIGGGATLAALFGWLFRPHPQRLLRAQILAAFALILLAGLYRTRPDTWAADNLDFGDRYFYIPRVLLAWLLIWEFHSTPRFVATLARTACVLVLVVHLADFTLRAPKDYEWAKHVETIRRGTPAEIPILPEGWTMEYRGRAK